MYDLPPEPFSSPTQSAAFSVAPQPSAQRAVVVATNEDALADVGASGASPVSVEVPRPVYLPSSSQGPRLVPMPVAMGVEPVAVGHMLGFACVAVGLGSLAGARWGVKGAAAGAITGGAVVNATRALLYAFNPEPEARKEAIVSGTWALVCGGIAGYLAWQLKSSPRLRVNRELGCATANGARSCGIRPV